MNALDINENYKNFYTNKEISHARKDNDTVGKKELLKSNNTENMNEECITVCRI